MIAKTKSISSLQISEKPQINGISRSKLLELFTTMLRIRRVEEALMQEYHPADEMRCPIHFCIGQEAPPAAVCSNLGKDDYVFSHHRSHGYYLAKGGGLHEMFAEFYGKATGSSAGKGGHQEICDVSANIYSGPILAGQLPIAAGVAWAFQARQEDRVAVVVLGDGSADGGIVYETLNFAALKRLPLLFICENNSYSTFSPQWARQAVCNLAGRANVFGVPARRLYGNDVAAVYKAARVAVARARRGDGPSFLELVTYRWCGHVGPEDDDYLEYRPAEELKAWQKRCPIEALKRRLLERELIDCSDIESIELNITAAIQDAFAFAKSSPFPEPGELLTHNFAENSQPTDKLEHPLPRAIFDCHQAESRLRPY